MTGSRGHQQKEKAVSVRHFMGAHIKLGSPFASVLLLQTNSLHYWCVKINCLQLKYMAMICFTISDTEEMVNNCVGLHRV